MQSNGQQFYFDESKIDFEIEIILPLLLFQKGVKIESFRHSVGIEIGSLLFWMLAVSVGMSIIVFRTDSLKGYLIDYQVQNDVPQEVDGEASVFSGDQVTLLVLQTVVVSP